MSSYGGIDEGDFSNPLYDGSRRKNTLDFFGDCPIEEDRFYDAGDRWPKDASLIPTRIRQPPTDCIVSRVATSLKESLGMDEG